ncbi:uncharacterized protein LOC131258230 isoform X3 [Magnolia sinica]|uniref:uncharacterized protein LOC131258230 isoform X3 n=1 Tax=Magnolia sinica TaxID=86752 RepID=UPI002658A375|nr:uncharacterized protein LOC131258230 isoform X3 [Magnolia sinica]
MEGQIQHLYKSGWMGTYDVDQVELTYLKAKWILSFVMLWRKEVLSRLNSGRSKGSEPSKQICPCRCRIAVAGVEVILYVNFHCENMLMHLWSRHGYDYIEFLYKGVKGFEDKKMVNGFNLTMTIQFHRWRKTSQSSRVEVIGTWHTFACIKLKEFIFKFNGKPKLKYFYTVDQ